MRVEDIMPLHPAPPPPEEEVAEEEVEEEKSAGDTEKEPDKGQNVDEYA